MHKTAFLSSLENAKTLIELGASPNYRDPIGLTPLYYNMLTTDSNDQVSTVIDFENYNFLWTWNYFSATSSRHGLAKIRCPDAWRLLKCSSMVIASTRDSKIGSPLLQLLPRDSCFPAYSESFFVDARLFSGCARVCIAFSNFAPRSLLCLTACLKKSQNNTWKLVRNLNRNISSQSDSIPQNAALSTCRSLKCSYVRPPTLVLRTCTAITKFTRLGGITFIA